MKMKINICDKEYLIEEKITNLLDILNNVKKYKNQSLSYKYGCKSGICGSCSVRVNGVETLACTSNVKDNDVILPLKNLTIIKDLVVDNTNIQHKLLQSKSQLDTISNTNINQSNVDKIDIQSNCILCNSCFSSCPVLEVNNDFIGPFALTRAFRYINDVKEQSKVSKLDAIQTSGIWDCTLCGACDLVCPSNIPIKNDIIALQNLSVQSGYENPAFSSNSSFDDGFDNNDFSFGFNP